VGFELDEFDAKIVSILHADGRTTNTEVARRLGCGEATVRKRVARLLDDGVMQFQAWVDPLKVGYEVYAIIQIQVSPPRIEAVAETLGKLPEIAFLGVCTGDFDIFAAAVFRSNADLYDFLTKRLSEVPGIIRTATSSMIRLVKREYAFPIPAGPFRESAPARSLSNEAGRRATSVPRRTRPTAASASARGGVARTPSPGAQRPPGRAQRTSTSIGGSRPSKSDA
jgi:Lrp/AsnC family transcriptional regulator for asnA, asnC and gidA